jgi:hypothetical protein
MQVLLPFTTMELAILRCLQTAPSQIHPLSWALMKAFQLWCQAKKCGASGPLFFNLFHVSFFEVDGLYGFALFTQPQKLFEEFGDLPSDFLRRFYFMSPKTSISHDHLCKMTATDDQGTLEREFCRSCFRKY